MKIVLKRVSRRCSFVIKGCIHKSVEVLSMDVVFARQFLTNLIIAYNLRKYVLHVTYINIPECSHTNESIAVDIAVTIY